MMYFQNWFLSQVNLQFNQGISYPLSDMIVGTYDCRVWYMYSLNISAFVVENNKAIDPATTMGEYCTLALYLSE